MIKIKRNYFKIVGLLLLSSSSLGCASLMTRGLGSEDASWPEFYAGVGADLGAIVMGGKIGEGPEWPIPLAIVDLPFSFAMDTICLPYDWFKAEKKSQAKKTVIYLAEDFMKTQIDADKYRIHGSYKSAYHSNRYRVYEVRFKSLDGSSEDAEVKVDLNKKVCRRVDIDRLRFETIAHLAEDFMKIQNDANKYRIYGDVVYRKENNVYVVAFQPLNIADTTEHNVNVEVNLDTKVCKRIDMDISMAYAAHLAEDFMKTQKDERKYITFLGHVVYRKENNVYLVTFEPFSPLIDENNVDIEVNLDTKVCKRIGLYEGMDSRAYAAHLAEDFMKTQIDADKYIIHRNVVYHKKNNVYVVKFQLDENSAYIEVNLDTKVCKRMDAEYN